MDFRAFALVAKESPNNGEEHHESPGIKHGFGV